MPSNPPVEENIKSDVKAIYVDYASELGRDVSDVTPDTKLKFPYGLEFSSVQMKSRRNQLNDIIALYNARYLTDTDCENFSTIKDAQDKVWKRVKPTEA